MRRRVNKTESYPCRLSAAGKRALFRDDQKREGEARDRTDGRVLVRWDGNESWMPYAGEYIERIT